MQEVLDKSIDDTGERMVPAYHKTHMVYGEHIVRYQAAIPLVKGKVVLDIASGSGYGSSVLGSSAKHVHGVDIDEDAIKYATKNYASKSVSFTLGDGRKIPLEDNAVDVVVSFETIEHIEDYKTFMAEVKRVLKDDGLFILSTPNDVEFPETNHYHVHEFERKELESLVKKYFKNSKSYYQASWLYNALAEEKILTGEWTLNITTMQTAPIKLEKCIYFYMLCSNRKVTETVEPLAAISEHYSERTKLETEASVRKHIDDQATIMEHQVRTIESQSVHIKQLEIRLDDAEKKFDRLYNTAPVRVLRKGAAVKRRLKK